MRKPFSYGLCVALLILVSTAGAARASVITFESQSLGLTDPFVIPIDGTNVSFASPAVFSVATSFFSTLTGHVLLDADPIVGNLVIGFSNPVKNLSLNFALNSPATTSFLLQAYSGGIVGTLVGSTSALGSIPGGFTFPEGVINFSGITFDTLRLSTAAQDFAVDNISFTADAAVPEPASLLLLGTGVAGLIAKRHRRRRC